MWAHYAANSAGFVIAFNTTSEFFRRGENHELQALHKVHYFDGRISEMIDDPFIALNSKQKDWAYEHEWRLYVEPDHVTEVLKGDDDIHLVAFPKTAVQRVILGPRANPQDEARIRAALQQDYEDVPLLKMHADRATATLVELPAN